MLMKLILATSKCSRNFTVLCDAGWMERGRGGVSLHHHLTSIVSSQTTLFSSPHFAVKTSIEKAAQHAAEWIIVKVSQIAINYDGES